jgi:hypothetical protein
MDLRAISLGFVLTLILGLVIQLVYILAITLIGAYGINLPSFAPYKETLWLIGAVISFALAMLAGGIITTLIARTNALINPVIVCTAVSIVSLLAALNYSALTWFSVVVIPVSALLSIVGAKMAIE